MVKKVLILPKRYGPNVVDEIAKKHGVTKDQIEQQLKMGIAVEREHKKDDIVARQIALDHLQELPDYYTKLKNNVETKDVKKEELEEAFTQHYEYGHHVNKSKGYEYHNYGFRTNKGHIYTTNIEHEPDDDEAHVSFFHKTHSGEIHDKSTGVTGDSGGESHRIFSTVHHILKHHLKQNPHINHVTFSSAEANRTKLYRHMAKKFAHKHEEDKVNPEVNDDRHVGFKISRKDLKEEIEFLPEEVRIKKHKDISMVFNGSKHIGNIHHPKDTDIGQFKAVSKNWGMSKDHPDDKSALNWLISINSTGQPGGTALGNVYENRKWNIVKSETPKIVEGFVSFKNYMNEELEDKDRRDKSDKQLKTIEKVDDCEKEIHLGKTSTGKEGPVLKINPKLNRKGEGQNTFVKPEPRKSVNN